MKGLYQGLAVCLAIFIAAPYLPTGVLNIAVGSIPGAAVVLGAVLYVAMKNNLLGLAAFLASAALFLENRRRMIARIQNSFKESGQDVLNSEIPARNIIPNEIHPPHLTPDVDAHDFQPTKEEESNEFSAVGDSINEKQVLSSRETNNDEVAQMLQDKGLAPAL